MPFKSKTALVTGAASGLGRATALLLAQRRANVVVSDIDATGGQTTVEQILALGGEATFISCDVSQEVDVAALVAKTVDLYGSLDVAINNAGIGGVWAPTHEYPLDNFEQVLSVNLTGVFLCMKAELKQMLRQGSGSIVNVSSVSGLVGFPNNAAYDASKHAVVGLTKTAALEYAKRNIRVNAVCPVFTITPLVERMFEIKEGLKEHFEQSIPMRRYGQPEEVAEAIAYLASDAAGFITGQALAIDGGMTAG